MVAEFGDSYAGDGNSSHGVTSSTRPVANVERLGVIAGTGCSSHGVTSSTRPVVREERPFVDPTGYNSQGVTSAIAPVVKEGRPRADTDGSLGAGAGYNSQGVTSSGVPVAVEGRPLVFGVFFVLTSKALARAGLRSGLCGGIPGTGVFG